MGNDENVFAEIDVQELRKGVEKRRDELFRKTWKNRRAVMPLRSLHQEQAFKFVVEWYEEFDEVVGRERERMRLDKLLARGENVNAKEPGK